MRLALLMTNTDESEFARRHPKDGEKFRRLLSGVRPDWALEVFPVKDDVFPDDLGRFDGVMIGGSPASVHDASPWIDRLQALIREIIDRDIPLFGACFGHQAIALALGGEVGDSPDGWALGAVTTEVTDPLPWMEPRVTAIRLHAAHTEQVLRLPESARRWGHAGGCEIAGFVIGERVFTTQYHPEITAAFMAALLDELDATGKAPATALAEGRASLSEPARSDLFAQWIARFFEHACTLSQRPPADPSP